MADITFNTDAGKTIKRELLIAYLNTGTTATPIWSAVGKRVEDSSMEMDWGEETKNDILGQSYTTLKKPTITQSFEPCELDAGDAAQVKLWNAAVKDQDYAALAAMDMLIVHFYAGSAATPFAERYTACTVRPTSLGGEGGGNMGMPIDITYGGTRTVGTATKSGATITFTPSAAPSLPTLATFAISDATLSPTFSANVNSYTATASESSGTVTATAASGNVVIIANGNSLASGGSVSWAEGDNLVAVTVTKDGLSNTYEAHVSYTA